MAIEKSKYIMLDGITPIIFSSGISHDAFSAIEGEITSAGFVKIFSQDGKIIIACYGESLSLKLQPNLDDPEIIKAVMGL